MTWQKVSLSVINHGLSSLTSNLLVTWHYIFLAASLFPVQWRSLLQYAASIHQYLCQCIWKFPVRTVQMILKPGIYLLNVFGWEQFPWIVLINYFYGSETFKFLKNLEGKDRPRTSKDFINLSYFTTKIHFAGEKDSVKSQAKSISLQPDLCFYSEQSWYMTERLPGNRYCSSMIWPLLLPSFSNWYTSQLPWPSFCCSYLAFRSQIPW